MSKSFSRCECLQDSKRFIVSLALHLFQDWREAVGQAVWAVRYLKPETTVPPCVSFTGDHREKLKMRLDRLTLTALVSLLLEKCEDEK